MTDIEPVETLSEEAKKAIHASTLRFATRMVEEIRPPTSGPRIFDFLATDIQNMFGPMPAASIEDLKSLVVYRMGQACGVYFEFGFMRRLGVWLVIAFRSLFRMGPTAYAVDGITISRLAYRVLILENLIARYLDAIETELDPGSEDVTPKT